MMKLESQVRMNHAVYRKPSCRFETVKRLINVKTRQFGIVKMSKQDSLGCGNYGIISA